MTQITKYLCDRCGDELEPAPGCVISSESHPPYSPYPHTFVIPGLGEFHFCSGCRALVFQSIKEVIWPVADQSGQ